MRAIFVMGFILSCGLLVSCSEEDQEVKTPVATIVKSPLSREMSPDVSDEILAQLVTDNSEFAWTVYRELAVDAGDGTNIIYSPYSISVVMAMLYAGAVDQSKVDLAGALNFKLNNESLHKSFNKLNLLLNSRNLPEDEDYSALSLNMTQTLWPSSRYLSGMSDQFLDVLAEHYDSAVYAMDYHRDPEACRSEINDAVYQWTNERIEGLIPKGGVDGATSFVITNTLYMNAPWHEAFHASSEADFYNIDGSISRVEMMRYGLDKSMRYSANEQAQALAIPYRGKDLEMVILLPNAGEFETFEGALTSTDVSEMVNALEYTEGWVEFSMPKFSFSYEKSLLGIMEDLGMNLGGGYDLIDPNAEINGINHKAFIGVDEFGTESAAATSVSGSSGSASPIDAQFFVDRPFLFIIHDRPTGNILFAGRVTNLGG